MLSLLPSRDEHVGGEGGEGRHEVAHIGASDQVRYWSDISQAARRETIRGQVHEGHGDGEAYDVGPQARLEERGRALDPGSDLFHEERRDHNSNPRSYPIIQGEQEALVEPPE